MTTMLYDPPRELVDYVIAQRAGARRSEVLKTLNEQWARIVDRATFAEINTPIYIERNPKTGRLKVEFDRDPLHFFDGFYGPGVVVSAGYHGLTESQANRYLQSYLPWLEMQYVQTQGTFWTAAEGYAYIRVQEGTSTLRKRAFEMARVSARRDWGFNTDTGYIRINFASFDGSENGRVLNLGRMYWVLAFAKNLRENLTHYMREAFNMGRQEDTATRVTHSTQDAFRKHVQDRREVISKAAYDGGSTIANLPVIDSTTPTARTWGIEVEAAGARGVYEPNGWERKDDGSLRSAYNESDRQSRASSDCPNHDHNETVYRNGSWVENPDYEDPDYCDWLYYEDEDYYGDEDDTAEFVSPVLVHAGSEGLRHLVRDLSAEPQNDSAGIHVHVGASDLTAKQVGALVYAYATIEPLITDYYRREARNYCKEVPLDRVVEVVGAFRRGGKNPANPDERGVDNLDLGDRYYSVNLWSLSSHGTIEFRAMGPVYEYEHLVKWALFCREMVSIAKLGLSTKVWDSVSTWADVERILNTYGPELQAHTLGRLDFEPAKYARRESEMALAL